MQRKFSTSLFVQKCFIVLALICFLPAFAYSQSVPREEKEEATLRVMNRDIVQFRTSLAGSTPSQRAEHAKSRIVEIHREELEKPIEVLPVSVGNEKGVQFQLGDRFLFTLIEKDLDPDKGMNFSMFVSETKELLEELKGARQKQTEFKYVFRQSIQFVLATGFLVFALWGLKRVLNFINYQLLRKCNHLPVHQNGQVHWAEYFLLFGARVTNTIKWIFYLAFIYAWLTFTLNLFPLTHPLGIQLGGHVVNTFEWIIESIARSIPNLITILIIVLFTRALADLLKVFFRRVQNQQLEIPYFHHETVSATQRISIVVLWGLAIAIMYPFIPGSNGDAFKGISVLLGIVISLGSTGLVTQLMSGLVVVYSRAVRVGDFVQVGDVEGIVTEIGGLATKVQSVQQIETTIPNSVIISQSIKNYSRLNDNKGTLFTTKVTIGYDAPWRKIHELLIAAAKSISEIRTDPAPIVFQRALSDFYVEYELLIHCDEPQKKVAIMSMLHAAIQDQFNAAGIQIMSPHFMIQPDHPVLGK